MSTWTDSEIDNLVTTMCEAGVSEDDAFLLAEVAVERQFQEEKFPGQRLASVDTKTSFAGGSPGWVATTIAGVSESASVQQRIAALIERGELPAWADVLVEEVAEAIEAAAEEGPERAVEELIQVAAVAIRWAGAIKRGETL